MPLWSFPKGPKCMNCRLRVLDLGSGSGRDAFVCAALVGEEGHVTGIDFTEEQLEVYPHTACLAAKHGACKFNDPCRALPQLTAA